MAPGGAAGAHGAAVALRKPRCGSEMSSQAVGGSKEHSCNKRSRDPSADLRERIQKSLESYPGIKDADKFIEQRAQERVQKLEAQEQEYWAWCKKVKEEKEPSFKLPADCYAGKRPIEEEIMEKCDKAHRSMAEQDNQYQNWLQEVQQRQEERMKEKLQAKRTESAAYASLQGQQLREREAQLAKDKKAKAEKAARYWNWLADTKQDIATRPAVNCPLARTSGVKSVEELTTQKKAEMAKEDEERNKEYSAWLESIKKPAFTLPDSQCNSVAQRDAIIMAQAKKGVEKLNTTTAEYKKWLAEMEEKNKERMMQKVRDKLKRDAKFDHERRAQARALKQKMADKAEDEARVAGESKEAVKQMYAAVRRRPCIIETAYRMGPSFRSRSVSTLNQV